MNSALWTGLALLAQLGVAAQVCATEQSSLYVRCTMTSAHYAAAMAAPPGSALGYHDWQQWFHSRGIQVPVTLDKAWLRDSTAPTLQALLQVWSGQGTMSRYDEKTGRWQFALFEFTDNYGEMIQLLAPLRSMARYCEADSDSFLVIYSYLWGNGDNAYLTLDHQRSQFAKAPTQVQRAEADAALQGLMDAATQ